MAVLSDYVKVIRSKNAGPFELTFDLIFLNEALYNHVLQSEVITKAKIAELYNIPLEHVLVVERYDPALAIKITIARRQSSGSYGERDTLGAQQHAPLLFLTIPDGGQVNH
jgi:hypothetical protein